VTIYYFPNPSAPPATTDTAYKIGDIYVNQNNSITQQTGGSGLSAGKKLWTKYSATTPVVPIAPAPAITAATLISTTQATRNSALTFTPVTAYGGAGVLANRPLTVTVSPALPAGLTLKTTKTDITVTSFGSKSGSTGNFSVTLNFASTTAPVVGNTYLVEGNARDVYNGHYVCTAATTTSITLRYPHDPGVFGAGTTTIRDDTTKIIQGGDQVSRLFNWVDVTITGTPTQILTNTTYVVTFTDAAGQTSSANFNLAVITDSNELVTELAVASRTLAVAHPLRRSLQ